jgi:hypothetical protein
MKVKLKAGFTICCVKKYDALITARTLRRPRLALPTLEALLVMGHDCVEIETIEKNCPALAITPRYRRVERGKSSTAGNMVTDKSISRRG